MCLTKHVHVDTVCFQVVFPAGVPEEANIAAKDIHYIQVPQSAYPEGMDTALVDFYKKNDE